MQAHLHSSLADVADALIHTACRLPPARAHPPLCPSVRSHACQCGHKGRPIGGGCVHLFASVREPHTADEITAKARQCLVQASARRPPGPWYRRAARRARQRRVPQHEQRPHRLPGLVAHAGGHHVLARALPRARVAPRRPHLLRVHRPLRAGVCAAAGLQLAAAPSALLL